MIILSKKVKKTGKSIYKISQESGIPYTTLSELMNETGALRIYKDNGSGLSPFLGNADTRKMKRWWEGRAVPASRNMIKEVLRQASCPNTKMYLAKNLALSMTDSYWIRPLDMDLKMEVAKE